MGFLKGMTGEKCLVPGTYNPEHRDDNTINLMITKGEEFPLFEGVATVWEHTECFSVLREYYLRYFGAKPN